MARKSIYAPARIHRRALAWIYDALIVVALWMVSGLISVAIVGGSVAPRWLTLSVLTAVIGSYFAISWTRIGATAGMRAWRLRVVGFHGKLTFRESTKRLGYCLLCLAPIPLMLLPGLLRSDRATIYDRLSQTQVRELIKVHDTKN